MVKVKEDMSGWVMSEHGVPDSGLTVVKQVEDYIDPNGNHVAQWLCECSCDLHKRIVVTGRSIKNGNTKSCGCWMREKAKMQRENFRKLNKYDLSGEYGIGFTSNTNREFYFDIEDYDKIKDYTWCEHISSKDNYTSLEAWDAKLEKHIRMHYIVYSKNCDHKDRNPFNNRKENLRESTYQENARNSSLAKNNKSGIIGVYWHKREKAWAATIVVDYHKIHLGAFYNKEAAIIARLKAELEYFGREFAPQRHLFEKYDITNNLN